MNKEFLQDIILEEANNEYAMLDEGFWDKLKARAKGAVAGAKQMGSNLADWAKDSKDRIVHGRARYQDETQNKSDDSVKAYNNTKFESWKESMTSKIRKFEAQMSKKAKALVEEIFSDAEDIGLDDITDDIDGKTYEVLNQVKSLCTRIGKTIDPDYAKKRSEQK